MRYLLVLLFVTASVLTGCSGSADVPQDGEKTSTAPATNQVQADKKSGQLSTDDREAIGDQTNGNRATAGIADTAEPVVATSIPTQDEQEKEADWPHWRGPLGNNQSKETGLIKEFPTDGPRIVWRQELGSGFSGLSVSGDQLYTLFGKGGREYVACFSIKNGEEVWKVDLDKDFAQGRSFGPRSTPCVDGNRVYAIGASGVFCCLNTQNGDEIWSFNLYDKFNMRPHEEGLSCSPLIDGKTVFVATGNSAFAFDKSTGELIWRALEEKMNHSTPTLGMLDGKKQLIVLTAGNLVGLNPEDGKEYWRYPQQGVNCVTPVVGPGNRVFTGAAYGFGCQLVKVEGDSATQVYKNSSLSTHHATAMHYEGHLYGFHDRPGIFKCIEFATGEEKWVSRVPGKGKLIIADGQMILINEYGELMLATPSPEGYRQTARAKVVSGTCYTAPSLVNGMLYVRSDKEMVCIDFKK